MYKHQRNYVVKLNKKAKESYFCDLGTSSDFWQSTRNLFNKGSHNHEKIHLLDEHDNIIDDDKNIAEDFNSFFVNITRNLFDEPLDTCQDKDVIDIEHILDKYRNHPSIMNITQSLTGNSFSYSKVTSAEVVKAINCIN
jgi:hypothetical protein